jgi:hypothetical protein
VLLLWRIPYYGKFVLDDPFITFRYARNLIDLGQLTYNPGEYVLATTTPIYTLLSAVIYGVGLPIPLAPMLVNLCCEIALLYVLSLIIEAFNLAPRAHFIAYAVTSLLVITNRAMSIASQSALETPLFVLLSFAALLHILKRNYTLAAIFGAFATLTRPDGVFVLVTLAAAVFLWERRLPVRETLIGLGIGLPWMLVALATYGTFIPHSVTAKNAIKDNMGQQRRAEQQALCAFLRTPAPLWHCCASHPVVRSLAVITKALPQKRQCDICLRCLALDIHGLAFKPGIRMVLCPTLHALCLDYRSGPGSDV